MTTTKTRKVLAWLADPNVAADYAASVMVADGVYPIEPAYVEVSYYPGDALPYEVVVVWEGRVDV